VSSHDELFHQVGALVGDRPGWSLEMSTTPGQPASWCYEHRGEVELSVSVDRRRIVVYLAREDRDIELGDTDELAAWLDANEGRFRRS
jgi:hypothetical protein